MRDRAVLHELVVDSLEEQIAVIDETGAIVDVNSAWKKFGIENGLAQDSAGAGANYLEVLRAAVAGGDELATDAARGISDVMSGRAASFSCEYPCHSPVERRWFAMRVARLQGGLERLFVVSHHDITRRKLAEERAEHLALHDELTGLANRRLFGRFLGEEIRRGARNQSPVGVVAFDLDGFKEYNDVLGHLAGDRCLAGVAGVLAAHARRATDLAARLGGDEFALILGNTDLAGRGENRARRPARRRRPADRSSRRPHPHDQRGLRGGRSRLGANRGWPAARGGQGALCRQSRRRQPRARLREVVSGSLPFAGASRRCTLLGCSRPAPPIPRR